MTDEPTAWLDDIRTVCDLVETSLGPTGANKLVVAEHGTVTLTASGASVLETLELETAAIDLLRSAATDFRDRHGDGTTTVVTLVGGLLDAAVNLRDTGLHPTTIERGYREAIGTARDRISELAKPIDAVGPASVARTAMTGVPDPSIRLSLGDRLAEAFETARAERVGIERRDIGVVTRVGGSVADTELIRGVVLDSDPVLPSMPRRVEGGIGLIASTIDLPRLGSETSRRSSLRLSFSPERFEERDEIGDFERERFDRVLDAVDAAGCTALITESAVNDRVKRTIADRGILAVQRVDADDLGRVAQATGASVVPDLAAVGPDALGTGSVDVRRLSGRDMSVVRSTHGDPVFTLLTRSPDPRSLDEVGASMEAGVAALVAAHRGAGVIPGGGAAEMAAAHAIRTASTGIGGREQLGMRAVADAFEGVPRTLARAGGCDPTDAMIELRSAHADGRAGTGVDAVLGTVDDLLGDDPVVEPVDLKLAAWEAAVDLAIRLVRIDARLEATSLTEDEEDDPARLPADDGPSV